MRFWMQSFVQNLLISTLTLPHLQLLGQSDSPAYWIVQAHPIFAVLDYLE